MAPSRFSKLLVQELASNIANSFSDNVDPVLTEAVPRSSLPTWNQVGARVKLFGRQLVTGHPRGAIAALAALRNDVRSMYFYRRAPHSFFVREAERYGFAEFLYERLADDDSRNLLLKLLAYRILGHTRVKLPRNTPEFWESLARVNKLISGGETIKSADRFDLILLDLKELGTNARCFTTPTAALHLCVQEQYAYRKGGIACKVAEGDIVIDAGACWGDSSLYFAGLAGDKGKVYCFEFIPSNLSILRRNFTLNPHLASRINVVERPIWERTGHTLYYLDRGPGSYVAWKKTSDQCVACETLSIDDLVREKNLPRVDFIKMDIEGAELPALKGAENTLKEFKPKLAISAYHKQDDFETIPRYLESLDLGYCYYLEHHTIHLYETVLYAVADRRP